MDQLSKLLKIMTQVGASDLFLSPGRPPAFRVNGKILPPDGPKLTPDKIEQMARLLMMEEQHQAFQQNPDLNLGITIPNIGRFRVNIFRQRHHVAMVVRAIPDQVRSIGELGLPETLSQLVMLQSGLVIIVGPAGTGKSTTLAALIEQRARNEICHVMTLEDPIEYLFKHEHSVINQREIGTDTISYHQGLINALRQSPDVLMLGEIRERDVLELMLEFSDTGHLCMATMHAKSVVQTIERMLLMFPENERGRALNALAQNLRAVIAQRLIPDVKGKLALAYEMHTFTAHTKDLIRRNEIGAIEEFIHKDTSGMSQTMDQSLFKLFKAGRISPQTALKHANSIANMRLQMRLEQKPTALAVARHEMSE